MREVSVIIPTWNRLEVLPRALDSVYAQSLPPAEVLVVDDGSSDGSAEMISRRYPGVRLLTTENRGVSAARNLGIAEARGDWLALLDSDDAWRPEKLERQLAALDREPRHRICHTDEIWIRDGRRVNPGRRHRKRGGRIFRHCLELCAISPSSVLVDRRLLERVGGFDESLPACEDYDLWLRIAAEEPVLLVPEPLTVKYGGHPDQLSRRIGALDRYRIRALSKTLEAAALGAEDRRAAVRTLLAKIEVYAGGVARRGRAEELAELTELRRFWERELAGFPEVSGTSPELSGTCSPGTSPDSCGTREGG